MINKHTHESPASDTSCLAMDYPIAFVCPTCKGSLVPGSSCGCITATRLELWEEIPRTLFGQAYWGESSRDKMARVLTLMDEMHWTKALGRVMPDDPVRKHLTRKIGPEFVHGLPWTKIGTVLDIGSGMGFLAAPLASFGRPVVALEAVPERALFLQKRARQDGLDNLQTVIGNAMQMPFAPESFDLITMNGVFEYVGLWGNGDPRDLQMQFLLSAKELLRPGGLLYIGIETRFGVSSWLGGRDHSGLRFTGIMPRSIANSYCRLRKSPIYGGESPARGYRTYCHTPRQYERMLARAGFEQISVLGVFPGYNEQSGIYPLDDFVMRSTIRRHVDQPSSTLGAIKRFVIGLPALYRGLEDEVLLFATKAGGTALSSSFQDPRRPNVIGQLSTDDKVIAVRSDQFTPRTVVKLGKSEASRTRLAEEFHFLKEISVQGPSTTDVLWSAPLEAVRLNGEAAFEYEYAAGKKLSFLLAPPFPRVKEFLRLISKLCAGYLELSADLARRLALTPSERRYRLEAHLEDVASTHLDDKGLREKLKDGCAKLWREEWICGCTHGDLCASNVFVQRDGKLMLIDWENVRANWAPSIDLVRFYYDVCRDSRHLRAPVRQTLLKRTAKLIGDFLRLSGVAVEDLMLVEALFVVEQLRFKMARDDEIDSVLMAYRERPFDRLVLA